jgi:SAM-dependent methyltransferase
MAFSFAYQHDEAEASDSTCSRIGGVDFVQYPEIMRKATWTPEAFRDALARVANERDDATVDAWVDEQLGLDGLGDDGPALPRGCVPYLPTSIATLRRAISIAGIGASDTFVDIGSGIGRVTALVHLLTGAAAVGLEIQPQLVHEARQLAARLETSQITVVEGDAAELIERLSVGTVFYLYAPFSGARLDRVLAALDAIARTRPIRVCTLHVPLPERASWIPLSIDTDLAVYRSA